MIDILNYSANLKTEALADAKRRSRLVITQGYDSILCLHRSSYVRPHRHPEGKHETYNVIEGKLVLVLPADGEVLFLEPGNCVRIHGGTWHQPMAMSEYAIYHETYMGPFDKDVDVEYAEWAKAESA